MGSAKQFIIISILLTGAVAAPSAFAQAVINETFNSTPWIADTTTASTGTIDTSTTIWRAVSTDGTNTVQSLEPRPFPGNDGYVFGGTPTDTNANGTIDQFDFNSTESALGIYHGSVGDARSVTANGTNNAGRTVGYWRLQYDAETWISRINTTTSTNTTGNSRAENFVNVTLNGTALPNSASVTFANDITPATALPAGAKVVNNGLAASNFYIDGNLAANNQRAITSDVLKQVVAPGSATVLNWGTASYNGTAKNLGLAVDNVRLVAIAAGDFNADFTVTNAEAFDTFSNIGATGVTYTSGDADGDGVVANSEAFDAFSNIGTYVAAAPPAAPLRVSPPKASALTATVSGKVSATKVVTARSKLPLLPGGPYTLTTTGTSGDGKATVVYDPSSGKLTLEDVGGAGIKGLEITAETDADRNAGTAPSTLITFDPTKAVIPSGAVTISNTSKQLSYTQNNANIVFNGDTLANVGYIQTGLTLAQLAANLTVTYARFNVIGTQFGDVQVVPEPTAFALLGGISSLLLMRRRRLG